MIRKLQMLHCLAGTKVYKGKRNKDTRVQLKLLINNNEQLLPLVYTSDKIVKI